MTDATSDYAGGATTGLVVTCILNEGAPTLASNSYDVLGQKQTTLTWAAELDEGDWVALENDDATLYDACEGAPVVRRAATTEVLVLGRIVSLPRVLNMPATDAAADTIDERIAGKYYRYANVELMGGITSIQEATVKCDGTNTTVPGVGTTLKLNLAEAYGDDARLQLVQVASTGSGIIPFHTVPATTDGDTYSCLVGINGLLTAITGD